MKEPIRIAHIVGKWVGGGVEAVIMNYYRHIDKSKIQFDFICDSDSTNIPYEEIESMGGRVIIVPPYQKLFKYQKELKKVFGDGNYKIVHSHINTLSVFPLRIAKKFGIPVRIAHSHSTTNKREWKKNLLKQVLRPFSKVYATDYFACSELAGRWLFGNKEYDKGNVYLLNNAIDVDKFKYDEELRRHKRKELGIDDNTLVIGHVGRFVEQKNHEFLIDIFNEVCKKEKNAVLLLVGQGPLEDKIKAKVNDYGLSKNVKFLGQRNDVNELYQAFDVFLLPSLYEGLPVVGVEAQSSGLLCVFSSAMTKETKILDSTVFLDLNLSSVEWADEIIEKYKVNTRKKYESEITNSGFDIYNEVIKIEKFYKENSIPTIIHVVNSNVFSGLENVVCDIIKSELNEKYRFIYVTQNGPIIEILNDENIEYEIINKLTCKEIKRVVKKYNPIIIHAHDFTASVICAFVKKNKYLIEHIHNNCPWLKKVSLNSFAFLYAGIRANKVLIVSKSIEKEYIFSNFIRNKIECVDNPISREKILSKVKTCDYEKKYDICCVARITEQKNPYKFLEILYGLKKENNDIKAVWVGDGELRESVLRKVTELNLSSNIEFVGFKKNPYIFMAQSKIFMLTSDWEGFGLVAFEALTLGLPCVVSNVGGLPVIVDSKCGMLCIKQIEFINEISMLLKDRNYYHIKMNNAILKSKKIDNYNDYIKLIYNKYMMK